MWKIVVGLVSLMLANILLGASYATLKKEFNWEKFWNGFAKFMFIVVAICLMYLCSYLNPDIMVANINGQEVNLISGMEVIFIAGIVFYGYQDLVKLKDLLQLKLEIKEEE